VKNPFKRGDRVRGIYDKIERVVHSTHGHAQFYFSKPGDPLELVCAWVSAYEMVDSPADVSGDEVNAPAHYFVTLTDGQRVECKPLIRALGLSYALGNVVKYIWRAGRKTPDVLTDLRKARTYLDDEIRALEAADGAKGSDK
jgi:hypothetical protein